MRFSVAAIMGFIFVLGVSVTDDSSAAAGRSDDNADKLEEIIVTAKKRQENLQQVPQAIEVVSGDALLNDNVNSIAELSLEVPGLELSNEHRLYATLSIRGLGTPTDGFAIQPSVGMVVDGVVMGRNGSSMPNFNDVDRVEVLSGPQGTLFGKNASAGVINVTTKDPTQDLEANVGASYGSYKEVQTFGAISGPLIDGKLSARISFVTDNYDGFIRNIYDGSELNGSHQQGFRGKLLFTPVDGTRLMLIADYNNIDADCCVMPIRAITPASNLAEKGLYPGFTYPPGFVGTTNDEIDGKGPLGLINRSKGLSINWDQQMGDFTLTSISAYRTWDAVNNGTLGFNTTPITSLLLKIDVVEQHQLSEELRVTSPKGQFVDYVAGLFFYKDSLTNQENFVADFAPDIGTPPGAVISSIDYFNTTGDTNYAAFGEANFHVTNDVTLIAGVRESHEQVDFNQTGHYLFEAPLGAVDSSTVTNTSWRGGARWQINPNFMVYATVSRGYKGPAFNGNSTILGSAQNVNPEQATSYEIGWKSELFDDRLRFNADFFYTNLDNFQVQGYVNYQGMAVQFLTNAPQMRTQGVEMQLEARPVKNLSVNLNAAYIDARYTDFPNAPCYSGEGCVTQSLDGVATPSTPKYSFGLFGDYDIVLPGPLDAFVRADYSYKSKIQWDPTNSPWGVVPGYGLLGASVGLRSKDGRVAVTAFGKNLTNQFNVSGIDFIATPVNLLELDYRRLWGVRFEYRFRPHT